MNERTRTLVLGFGGGLLTAAVLPFVYPVVAEVARPLTKAVLKQLFVAVDRARSGVATASEALEDILAEVRAELSEEATAPQVGSPGGAGGGKNSPQVPGPVQGPLGESARTVS